MSEKRDEEFEGEVISNDFFEHTSTKQNNYKDSVSRFTWAFVFIWAGLVLLAQNLGLLEQIFFWAKTQASMGVTSSHSLVWPVISLGTGVFLLLEVVVRLAFPSFRRRVNGTVFLAFFFIALGLGNLLNLPVVWALLLIGLGFAIILRGI